MYVRKNGRKWTFGFWNPESFACFPDIRKNFEHFLYYLVTLNCPKCGKIHFPQNINAMMFGEQMLFGFQSCWPRKCDPSSRFRLSHLIYFLSGQKHIFPNQSWGFISGFSFHPLLFQFSFFAIYRCRTFQNMCRNNSV